MQICKYEKIENYCGLLYTNSTKNIFHYSKCSLLYFCDTPYGTGFDNLVPKVVPRRQHLTISGGQESI